VGQGAGPVGCRRERLCSAGRQRAICYRRGEFFSLRVLGLKTLLRMIRETEFFSAVPRMGRVKVRTCLAVGIPRGERPRGRGVVSGLAGPRCWHDAYDRPPRNPAFQTPLCSGEARRLRVRLCCLGCVGGLGGGG